MCSCSLVPTAKSSLLESLLSEEGISMAIWKKLENLVRLFFKLKIIENHQDFLLLKNCFKFQNLHYILRASPANSRIEDLERFDDCLYSNYSDDGYQYNVMEKFLDPSNVACSPGRSRIKITNVIALSACISSLHKVRVLEDGILNNIHCYKNNV